MACVPASSLTSRPAHALPAPADDAAAHPFGAAALRARLGVQAAVLTRWHWGTTRDAELIVRPAGGKEWVWTVWVRGG